MTLYTFPNNQVVTLEMVQAVSGTIKTDPLSTRSVLTRCHFTIILAFNNEITIYLTEHLLNQKNEQLLKREEDNPKRYGTKHYLATDGTWISDNDITNFRKTIYYQRAERIRQDFLEELRKCNTIFKVIDNSNHDEEE